MFRETLKLEEEVLGENHPYTFETLNNLADLLKTMGNAIFEKEKLLEKENFDNKTGHRLGQLEEIIAEEAVKTVQNVRLVMQICENQWSNVHPE